jgi:hypothetical protein
MLALTAAILVGLTLWGLFDWSAGAWLAAISVIALALIQVSAFVTDLRKLESVGAAAARVLGQVARSSRPPD